MTTTPLDIVDFWRSAGSKAWFARNDAFDATLRERFEADHHAAARGDRDGWAVTAEGALALILLFDQFPRNMWRRSAHAFATDPLARRAARRAINAGYDLAIATDQDFSVRLSEALQQDRGPDAHSARSHREIIKRFGRFPHRNRFLGRETTLEEAAFLEAGGFCG